MSEVENIHINNVKQEHNEESRNYGSGTLVHYSEMNNSDCVDVKNVKDQFQSRGGGLNNILRQYLQTTKGTVFYQKNRLNLKKIWNWKYNWVNT